MRRISGLVRLVSSSDTLETLKPATAFGNSEGARADILRSIVVFLHATFEVVLRSQVPKPNRRLSFYSRADLEKALKLSGIDAEPFRPLFPPLTQMAKRRKRIVHDADLSHGVVHTWTVADDWQLTMWMLAVPAFYYRLRMSLQAASAVERAMHERLRTAMASHVNFGKQLLALPLVSPELQVQAYLELVPTLEGIVATLHLDANDFAAEGS
jgi:hypothetical protein